MNSGIIITDSAESVLTLIKDQFAKYFPEHNVIMVGPILLGHMPETTYEKYINKISKLNSEYVLNYFDKQKLDKNQNMYILPDLVYDICFDNKLEKTLFLSSEDESQVYDSDETYLKTRKISHYAAVLLRNRNVPAHRSELIRMFEVENSYIFCSNGIHIIFGAKSFMKFQGLSTLDFAAYTTFYNSSKMQKSASIKDVTHTLQEANNLEGREQIVILPDYLYDVYIRDTSKFDIPLSLTIFSERSLTFDPTENIYVPLHELCSIQETYEISKSYNINLDLDKSEITKFPLLSPSDIIVRWLGFRRGDLIKIHRTTGYYYRIVSD